MKNRLYAVVKQDEIVAIYALREDARQAKVELGGKASGTIIRRFVADQEVR